MRLDEPERRSLYDALAQALGDGQADTLMNLLPTHPLADMATRDDVNSLAVGLRGEMAELRGELRGEMAELRGEMALGFGAIERRFGEVDRQFGEIQGQFGDLRADIARDMRTNNLMLMTMMIAVATIIVSLAVAGVLT